jgi:hypothetical protein
MKKWVNRLNGALLGLMFLTTFYQVLARNVFFTTAMWTEELAKILFVFIVFLGSATLMENEGHICISILSDRLPASLARWHRLFVQLVLVAFGLGVLRPKHVMVPAILPLFDPGDQRNTDPLLPSAQHGPHPFSRPLQRQPGIDRRLTL